MLRAGQVLVCLQDFRLMGRDFAKGEAFPTGRYWRVAARLARRGKIGTKSAPSKNPTQGSGPPGVLPPGAPGPTNLKAVHRGRGRWVVVDENGQPQGEGTMTQAEAEKLVASASG